MKLRQIEFVIAIADTESFSQAAQMIGATQPTLSNSIAQLEEELGGKLFTRTTRKVELTDFGAHLLPSMRELLETQKSLEQTAKSFLKGNQNILRIGFSPLVDTSLMHLVMEPFRRTHPQLEIYYKECLLDDLEGRLLENSIDLSVIPRPAISDPFESCAFYEDPLYYLPQNGSSKLMQSPERVINLPATPLIVTNGACGLNKSLDALFTSEEGSWESYPGYALSYQVISEWVDLGIGAAILPAAKLPSEKNFAVPLILNDGHPACFQFDWVWSSNAVDSAGLRASLIDHIRNTVPKLVSGLDR